MILTSEYKKLDIYNIKINIFLFFGYTVLNVVQSPPVSLG